MMLRIIIAEDHRIVREGIRNALEQTPGMEVAAEAGNGREAIRLAEKLKPDVVLMDVGMPDLNGIEAARQLLSISPEVKVVGLSMYSDRRYVMGMLQAGASGYLLKTCSAEELRQALRKVASGHVYLSCEITGLVLEEALTFRSESDISEQSLLTAMEREVLQLLAEGKTNKEIAETLSISPKTSETHRRQIMEKLNLRTVAELTKYAIREGLTSL